MVTRATLFPRDRDPDCESAPRARTSIRTTKLEKRTIEEAKRISRAINAARDETEHHFLPLETRYRHFCPVSFLVFLPPSRKRDRNYRRGLSPGVPPPPPPPAPPPPSTNGRGEISGEMRSHAERERERERERGERARNSIHPAIRPSRCPPRGGSGARGGGGRGGGTGMTRNCDKVS